MLRYFGTRRDFAPFTCTACFHPQMIADMHTLAAPQSPVGGSYRHPTTEEILEQRRLEALSESMVIPYEGCERCGGTGMEPSDA